VTVVIGTAGHIDHGKTALLRALTGIDADRLPEEQRRGMTIDVGYAHLVLADGSELDFVDVPGHDRLVGNMLVGAGEIDAVMLVVAADDGPRAQTLEHLGLLDALRMRVGMAVVTKVDMVDESRVAETIDTVTALLARTSLAGVPVVAASAVTGEGLEDVLAALLEVRHRVQSQVARTPAGHRLAIDRAFGVRGRGVVVTGTSRGPALPVATVLQLLPDGGSVRVRAIQVHGREVQVAQPGRTALNIVGVDLGDLHRGMVLSDAPRVVATDRLLVALDPPVRLRDRVEATQEARWLPADRTRVRLHLGTDQVPIAVGRGGRDALDLADGRAVAMLRLARPVAAADGDRFVLRRPSPAILLAGGVVLDARPARGASRRRQTAARVAVLSAAVDRGSEAGIAHARLELHGAITGGRPGSIPTLAADVLAQLSAASEDAVSRHHAAHPGHPGMALALLRPQLVQSLRRLVTLDPAAAGTAINGLLEALVEDGRLTREADVVRKPGHLPPARDPALEAAMRRLEASLSTPTPPSLAAAAHATGCPEDGVSLLQREGRIALLGVDLAYATTTYQMLAARALAMASEGPLTPAAYRDATGTSRKYAIAIIEDLDRRGILRRTPAGHLMGPKAPRATSMA